MADVDYQKYFSEMADRLPTNVPETESATEVTKPKRGIASNFFRGAVGGLAGTLSSAASFGANAVGLPETAKALRETVVAPIKEFSEPEQGASTVNQIANMMGSLTGVIGPTFFLPGGQVGGVTEAATIISRIVQGLRATGVARATIPAVAMTLSNSADVYQKEFQRTKNHDEAMYAAYRTMPATLGINVAQFGVMMKPGVKILKRMYTDAGLMAGTTVAQEGVNIGLGELRAPTGEEVISTGKQAVKMGLAGGLFGGTMHMGMSALERAMTKRQTPTEILAENTDPIQNQVAKADTLETATKQAAEQGEAVKAEPVAETAKAPETAPVEPEGAVKVENLTGKPIPSEQEVNARKLKAVTEQIRNMSESNPKRAKLIEEQIARANRDAVFRGVKPEPIVEPTQEVLPDETKVAPIEPEVATVPSTDAGLTQPVPTSKFTPIDLYRELKSRGIPEDQAKSIAESPVPKQDTVLAPVAEPRPSGPVSQGEVKPVTPPEPKPVKWEEVQKKAPDLKPAEKVGAPEESKSPIEIYYTSSSGEKITRNVSKKYFDGLSEELKTEIRDMSDSKYSQLDDRLTAERILHGKEPVTVQTINGKQRLEMGSSPDEVFSQWKNSGRFYDLEMNPKAKKLSEKIDKEKADKAEKQRIQTEINRKESDREAEEQRILTEKYTAGKGEKAISRGDEVIISSDGWVSNSHYGIAPEYAEGMKYRNPTLVRSIEADSSLIVPKEKGKSVDTIRILDNIVEDGGKKEPYVLYSGKDKAIVNKEYFDLIISRIKGADGIFINGEHAVTFIKNGKPVAVVMPLKVENFSSKVSDVIPEKTWKAKAQESKSPDIGKGKEGETTVEVRPPAKAKGKTKKPEAVKNMEKMLGHPVEDSFTDTVRTCL